MTYYVIYDAVGNLIGVCNTTPSSSVFNVNDVLIDNREGTIPDLNNVVWNPEKLDFDKTTNEITKLDFMSRFTAAERIAAQSSTDPIIKDALTLLNMAMVVDVSDQRTQSLVGYMAMIGIIENSRVAEILA